jgi:hypothetical protein
MIEQWKALTGESKEYATDESQSLELIVVRFNCIPIFGQIEKLLNIVIDFVTSWHANSTIFALKPCLGPRPAIWTFRQG